MIGERHQLLGRCHVFMPWLDNGTSKQHPTEFGTWSDGYRNIGNERVDG